jgi:hypothetical protein
MENQKVEYKSNWQDSYLKTIAAFANQKEVSSILE